MQHNLNNGAVITTNRLGKNGKSGLDLVAWRWVPESQASCFQTSPSMEKMLIKVCAKEDRIIRLYLEAVPWALTLD